MKRFAIFATLLSMTLFVTGCTPQAEKAKEKAAPADTEKGAMEGPSATEATDKPAGDEKPVGDEKPAEGGADKPAEDSK